MSTTPRIWSTFTVKSKKGELKLRIQDSDREDEIIKIFLDHFANTESMNKAAGITNNKEAMEEWIQLGKAMAEGRNVIICCVDDGTEKGGELVAASWMSLVHRGEPDFDYEPRTKEIRKLLEIVDVLEQFDGSKKLEWDKYYDDKGIVVHPDYAGLGIAQRIFNVRRAICKAEGVPFCGAWVTSFGSQKAAARDGQETISEVSFEELEILCGVKFENTPPTCKYMIGRAM